MSSRRTDRTGKSGKQTSSRVPVIASAIVAVVAIAAVLFAVSADGDDTTSSAAPEGMAHVHGLGVDPGTGQLLAGTHYGVFQISEDGAATQVGPVQDYMGFTVIGPDHYLASGHPGIGQDAPGNLGLLETTDGGRTWQTLSLSGEADFHTLEARHGRVYGHSGGQLMVSEDKKTWEQRAPIAIADLAISPEDPDTILVTVQQGVGKSTDGGRTFSLVRGAPPLMLITWLDDGRVVGVDPGGVVHASDDDGKTWEQLGSAGGQPAALTADGDDVFIATRDGTVVESTDGGSTFDIRYPG